ncbi:MAG: hypothetical protein KAX31_05050, partial [Thermoplasmata archaeon]|nr:hypothetical protein [Thermoplasmata archaeon]
VPARVYFQSVYANENGASSIVMNGRNNTFTGNVTYKLSQGGSWIETHVRNITSLDVSQTDQTSVAWNLVPQLGVVYDVVFTLTEFDGTLIDEKVKQFRLPTPADIESVFHRPSVIYADTDATIVATVHEPQNGQTECRAHYIIDGGGEQSGLMDYDPGSDEYLLLIDNTSYTEGSLVEYWVTSFNDASGVEYTDASAHQTFRVYSNTAPDLIIDEDGITFISLDPRTQTMYDTNTTNAFVTIRNSGRGDASNVVLEMFDYNVSLDRQSISLIASGDSDIVRFDLQLAVGDHVLMFIVDPDDDIVEINEHNNYFSIEFTIEQAPTPPPPTAENPWAIVPFIIIPIILLVVFLLFFFQRGKTVNVSVLKVKEFTSARDHTTRFMYTCGYVEDEPALGITRSTPIRAEVGEILQVKPAGMHAKEDGDLKWEDAEVVKLLTDAEPSTEQEVRKLIKKG